jgi:lipid II:glycine glycyltransferase (peptidoglycan interpeptide bridge formation enzyme)
MLLPFNGETLDRGPNVIRRLDASEDEIWKDYEGKVRRNVQRARGEGVTVVGDPKGERLDDFLAIYAATMDRREANDYYYFPRSMFETLIRELPGRFLFTHAMAGGKVVSSDLMLLSESTAYYWLGGTLAESFALRPNDLLKHETFLLCRQLGKRRVVLGGGYKPDDGLIRYKRAFAPGSEATFRIGVRTFDSSMCDRLATRRRTWESAQGRDWNPAEGFFPPYRS